MDFDNMFSPSNNVDDVDGFDPIPQPSPTNQQQQQQDDEPQDFGFTQENDDNSYDAFGLGGVPTTPDSSSQQLNAAPASPSAQRTGVSPAKAAWDEKKAKQLAARKEQQQKALQNNMAVGKRELADFQDKRTTHTNKLKATNRTEERDNRTELEATLQNGTEWEKVAKYCDLKPKHDPKVATIPGNTERMRTLLIDLKNDKTAPAK